MIIKEKLKSVCGKAASVVYKMDNVILFESVPEYSDNTKAVFDEMLRRGLNKKYELVWVCEHEEGVDRLNEKFKDIDNVFAIWVKSFKFKYCYKYKAKAFVVCNLFLPKGREEQYYMFLAHGCSFKNSHNKYSLPDFCEKCDVLTLSPFFVELDRYALSAFNSNILPLGYPRTDDLFRNIDLKSAFPGRDFEKAVYWMPTYRQNRFGSAVHSSVSMPIIYDEKIALKINECAKENGVLIIVKPHDAQDLSRITDYDFSNLVFIKTSFFADKDFTNYQLLGSCDALLTDYSSVFYDFMLTGKPFGLTWDDFDEYNENEGFAVDVDKIMKGGEKLYNSDDLCAFISRLGSGEDMLEKERNEVKNMIFDSVNKNVAATVTDYIEGKI